MRAHLIAATCVALIVATALVIFGTPPADAEKNMAPPYGRSDDVAFAKIVWADLLAARMVGPQRISARPTKGDQPHGVVQQITAANVTIAGTRTRAVVKANHRGKGLKLTSVYAAPAKHLTGYAVMVKRSPGYDPKNADWFWAVFNPDGSVRDFNGVAIAGRVDTGKDNGCIGCHRKYGGADYEMLTER